MEIKRSPSFFFLSDPLFSFLPGAFSEKRGLMEFWIDPSLPPLLSPPSLLFSSPFFLFWRRGPQRTWTESLSPPLGVLFPFRGFFPFPPLKRRGEGGLFFFSLLSPLFPSDSQRAQGYDVAIATELSPPPPLLPHAHSPPRICTHENQRRSACLHLLSPSFPLFFPPFFFPLFLDYYPAAEY